MTAIQRDVPAARRRLLPAFLRTPGGVLGARWLLLVTALSLTAPLWLPYPNEQQDLAHRLSGPSAEHWLGTDELGRDILSRIFASGAETLAASAVTVVVAFGIGLPLALLAAEHGPRVERVTSRVAEVMLALPGTVILLAVIGVIGVKIYLVMAVLGLMISAAVYRVLLAVAQSVRQRLYVDAARVDGLGSVAVNVRHVVPGMATTIAVQAAQLFGIGLLIQSGLAFMGFGPPAPQPSWGGMIGTASQYVFEGPWLMVPTGAVLALTVIAANAIADSLTPAVAHAGRTRPRRAQRPAPAPERATAPAGEGLSVRGLTVGVDDGPALVTDVSVDVAPGRVLGLVGESGCGKTMTARSLLGLLPGGVSITGGSIRWQGRDLATLSQKELRAVRGREIALVSQEPMVALDPMFSVASQLTQPIRRMRGVGRRAARGIAARLLRDVGIVDAERVLRSYPHQLSGGMAQRVAIALALTGQPKLLVADEPTTALDVTVQAEILSLLRALVRDTGLSVVLVSHDLGVVADLCDDVAVMYAGQVVESGTAADVLTDPAHPYTMALLAANPQVPEDEPVPERLASIPGTVPAPGSWPSGCRFAGRCRFARDECTVPVPGRPAHGDGSVLCVRVDEIHPQFLPAPSVSTGVS
ncbi:dipeptide/oligopeptide/nickel ABC transporter permease/ATP-binding protein [Pseudonocardia nigra]|uniref:dipeptide/oligopeptide/nickel ABC transporter permease/ATP-binding protein n=1 Tax=Pseudonocardia nigra TaxID=1921578 RepID=UPI001C5D7F58|nr:dipeptide/oligopeptide/nickel ABC transporter permease/ATP-binding protein [Pseudonocardia nigra]